jgi:hypothetical protein
MMADTKTSTPGAAPLLTFDPPDQMGDRAAFRGELYVGYAFAGNGNASWYPPDSDSPVWRVQNMDSEDPEIFAPDDHFSRDLDGAMQWMLAREAEWQAAHAAPSPDAARISALEAEVARLTRLIPKECCQGGDPHCYGPRGCLVRANKADVTPHDALVNEIENGKFRVAALREAGDALALLVAAHVRDGHPVDANARECATMDLAAWEAAKKRAMDAATLDQPKEAKK